MAKGKGQIAENILEKAKELDIPVQKDPSLAELLGKLDINERFQMSYMELLLKYLLLFINSIEM